MSPRLGLAAALLCLAAPLGCEDDPPPAPPPRRAHRRGRHADAGAARRPGARGQAPPQVQVRDDTFTEPASRDPFRSYARTFIQTPEDLTGGSRDVKLARYALEDLTLVAIIIGTDSPYAMVKDPSGTGTILRRGMYVGRSEIIHAMNTRGSDYAVNWRVARITPARLRRMPDGQFEEVPAEIVFERQNPLDPSVQVVERSITLAAGRAGQQTTAAGPVGPIPGVGGPSPSYLPSNLGGVGGGSATGAILGTQQAVNQAVQPAPTVVVQVPPQQNNVAPAPPSNAPPPVQIFNGQSTSR
ncbi:MAG: hypothetical protein U0324_15360 [Polyangiales bacterium]